MAEEKRFFGWVYIGFRFRETEEEAWWDMIDHYGKIKKEYENA